MLRNLEGMSRAFGRHSKPRMCKIFVSSPLLDSAGSCLPLSSSSSMMACAAANRRHSNYAYAHLTDIAETTRFSPQRNRDYSAIILAQHVNQDPVQVSYVDITVDNSIGQSDPHVQSYDCGMSAVSLNSAMQSNVPSPFVGMQSSAMPSSIVNVHQSHLNMPGGQWSQEGKFMSQQLQSSHYTALRDSARSSWQQTYDEYATTTPQQHHRNSKEIARDAAASNWNARRMYSTNVKMPSQPTSLKQDKQIVTGTDDQIPAASAAATNITATISRKEQLKRAFKDYGATVIIFHVSISLASLGCCYLLVSGGIDMVAILEHLGLASTALTSKIATGASTFVVAYAIHKVFAPVRISITLGATPFIVRYLRSKGILKPKK